MIRFFLRTRKARVRSWLRGLRGPSRVEADMAEEFRLHLDLRTNDLVRAGMSREAAARQARVEFGHMDTHREQALEARGMGFLDQMRFSRLDVKLGLRMLAKYPGLSLVSVIGMTVAIAVAAGGFAAVEAVVNPTLPLPGGERVVSLQNSDMRDGAGSAAPYAMHDFLRWRDELESVHELGAYSAGAQALVMPDGGTDQIQVARMTASGFRVARAAPLLGRTLLDDDERAGAQPVLVIGYEEWQRVFGGDAGVIGRQVRLGTVPHTIVGVMPDGFRFPVNHQYWVPLQLEAHYEPGTGPSIGMFGRLAPGYDMEAAQAELATLGGQAAAAWPETHRYLRAQVLPYTYPYSGFDSDPIARLRLQAIKLAIALLLVVVAVNVSVLVYARTATRLGEIAVRTALGASRKRVVTQLFVEAVVLSGISAIAGIGIATWALDRMNVLNRMQNVPFWMEYRLSFSLVAYVTLLALLAGVIVGVLPALKVTGRRVRASLQQISARGSQIQLGPMWTAMIVLQVAIAVAALPYAVYVAAASLQSGTAAEAYPAEEIARTVISLEETGDGSGADVAADAKKERLLTATREFIARLEAEPDIAGAAVTRSFPGYEWGAELELEGGTVLEAQYGEFGIGLLPLFDVQMLAGRGFEPADAGAGSTAVIIDEHFARAAGWQPQDALGRRIRFATQPAADAGEGAENPWLEVVGVAPSFTVKEGLDPDPDPLLYQPLTVEGAVANADAIQIVMRLRGSTDRLAGRLHGIAAAVDPQLQATATRTAADLRLEERQMKRYLGIGMAAVTLSVLLLSAAGIYAMMSFTVARRRREIGIRAALGAGARQVLTGIFMRAGAQLGAGVLAGLVVALSLNALAGGVLNRQLPLLLPAVALIAMTVGLLAALGPARRGLSVEPTEALRGE